MYSQHIRVISSCKGKKSHLFSFFLLQSLSLFSSSFFSFFCDFLKSLSLVHNHPKQLHGYKVRSNKRNYCRHVTFKLQTIDGPCEVIVHTWETHLQPRSITPLGMGINCICLRHKPKIADMLHTGLEGLIAIVLKYLNLLMCGRCRLFFAQHGPYSQNIYVYIRKWLQNGVNVKFFAVILKIMWVVFLLIWNCNNFL